MCLGARYESQYQNEAMNITSRRWRLRWVLETRGGAHWPGGLDDGFPPKPPRMRCKTYRRLLALDRLLERRWNGWIQDWLRRIDPRVKQADHSCKCWKKRPLRPSASRTIQRQLPAKRVSDLCRIAMGASFQIPFSKI